MKQQKELKKSVFCKRKKVDAKNGGRFQLKNELKL
jgi:hypothetical protein